MTEKNYQGPDFRKILRRT